MRLLQNRMKKIKLFKYEKREPDGDCIGTADTPVFAGFIRAGVNAAESKFEKEPYGEKTEETLTFYCNEPINAECGDGIAFFGNKPTHKIISVNSYGSYAEIRAGKQV